MAAEERNLEGKESNGGETEKKRVKRKEREPNKGQPPISGPERQPPFQLPGI